MADWPEWLAELLRPESPATNRTPNSSAHVHFDGPSLADEYSASTSWADILIPHGWTCLDSDPDADGARWRHPAATAPYSATIRHACLFVYSTNTDFEVTAAGDKHGVTRFKAYAVLNHGGDMSAAYQHLKGTSAA